MKARTSPLVDWAGNHLAPYITAHGVVAFGAWALARPAGRYAAMVVAVVVVVAGLGPYLRILRTWRNGVTFGDRAAAYHQLIHVARNVVVQLQPACAAGPVVLRSNAPAEAAVTAMLASVVELVQTLVPGSAKVWASVREIGCDGRYRTIVRVGRFNAAREARSKPLHATKDATIRRLRASLAQGRCVIVTGSTRTEVEWTRQPNDMYGEDKSVLMGAVLVKTWTEHGFSAPAMVWIVSVSCDRENAFDESQVPAMQSCVDVFSTVANALARGSADRFRPGAPPAVAS